MTGCPNGCTRPYLGDVGFVGTTLGKYDVFLGGDFEGTRLNELYMHNVKLEEIPHVLRGPLFDYARTRFPARVRRLVQAPGSQRPRGTPCAGGGARMTASDLQNATAEDILSWTYRRSAGSRWSRASRPSRWCSSTSPARSFPQPEVSDPGHWTAPRGDARLHRVRPRDVPDPAPHPRAGREELEAMTGEHGDMLFRASVPLRNQCCAVRKVNPLTRALRDYDAWITGLRRDQTPTRAATPVVASDPGHDGMTKVVPLAAWSRDQVWDYLRAHGIRQHPALRHAATCRSAARRARGRRSPVNRSVPDVGGGRATPTRSACSIRRSR